MKLYFFKNTYDNVVTEEASLDLSWDEMAEMFGHHQIVESKESMPLFIAADFKTTDDYQRVQDSDAVARVAANVVNVNAIVLDYDGGATLENVITQLNGIRHLGYTSHSHRADGVTDKFRVILPLADPCPVEEWHLRKHDVVNLFPGTDHSTVNIARAFYLPSCPPSRDLERFAWNLDGALFDWRLLEAKEPFVPPAPIDVTSLVDDGVGPIVWETFDMVQFFKDMGLYLGPAGGNKHNVICPNRRHTDGGTVIWQDGSTAPRFYCSHTKCQDFDLNKHFTQKFGGWDWKTKYCKRKPPLTLETAVQAIKQRHNKNNKGDTCGAN